MQNLNFKGLNQPRLKEVLIKKRKRRIKTRNYPRLGRTAEQPFTGFIKNSNGQYNANENNGEERIYKEISEKLYTTYFSSVRELVIQNPFNRNATEVRVSINKKDNRIIIEDNGSGMDRKTIFNRFLVIGSGFSERDIKMDKGNRPAVGSKGIHRLCWQKLGRFAQVITETENEAYKIEMHQYDLNVRIQKIPRRGKTGTRWEISGLMRGIDELDMIKYIQKTSTVILSLVSDFKIFINGRSFPCFRNDGDRIKLSGDNFEAVLVFNSSNDKLKVSSNYIVIDEIELEGFGGYIESPRFNLTTNRDQVKRDETYNSIIESLRRAILKELLRISNINPQIIQKYREIFIRFAASTLNGTVFERLELAKQIPVRVLGQDWTRLEELDYENIFVEFSTNGTPSPKAERAAELNFPIILAGSLSEKLLIKSITKAKNISKLPNNLLDCMGKAIKAKGKFRTLLVNAAEVLKLMTQINIAIIPEEEVKTAPKKIVPNAEPLMVKFQSEKNSNEHIQSEFIERSVKKFSGRLDRPKYVITRDNYDHLTVKGIKIALCEMDRVDINALANPSTREIFINIRSIVIRKIFSQESRIQRVLLMEEISHELSHILGYGLIVHDTPFFKVQRMLKYIAMQSI